MIKINGDPYYEYRIREVINRTLPSYSLNLDNYKIDIELIETKSSAVYTEKQITKEQLKIAADIKIFDSMYNLLSKQKVDTYSTYEVGDNLPYSDLASQKYTTNFILEELAHSIILAIVAQIRSPKRS